MNILVAIDLSESPQIVVGQAKKLAKALSAKIWLLHVATVRLDFSFSPVGSDSATYLEAGGIRDKVAKKFRNEHRLLQQFSQELRSVGLDCTALLVEGSITETILDEAAKLSADMVILGSRGKGAVGRFLLGSTTEGVLHKSSVPVLIVPIHKPSSKKVSPLKAEVIAKGKILIIDDEPDVREWIKIHLSSAETGCDFLEAENGEEVIKSLSNEYNMMNISLAICDIQMPKVNGIECIDFLRQQAPGIPIIVLTGFPDVEMADSLIKKGVKAYLTKPIDGEKLVDLVKKSMRSIADWT
jgi:nucleotide-binding universal stress UspA family protein/CheY-like chemotaxis protein